MTVDQRAKLKALSRCTFPVGHYDKRFVRDLSALPEDTPLSEKQAAYLETVWHRYRKQHGFKFESTPSDVTEKFGV